MGNDMGLALAISVIIPGLTCTGANVDFDALEAWVTHRQSVNSQTINKPQV